MPRAIGADGAEQGRVGSSLLYRPSRSIRKVQHTCDGPTVGSGVGEPQHLAEFAPAHQAHGEERPAVVVDTEFVAVRLAQAPLSQTCTC